MKFAHYCVYIGLAAICSVAAIPKTISYQGVLTDGAGNARPDGAYQLNFAFYDTALGGSSLWSETQTVKTKAGVFSVYLGDTAAFDISFDKPYWLGIAADGGAEQSPRVRLTSGAYAFRAEEVDRANVCINAIKADSADTAKFGYTAENARLWNGKQFEDYINQSLLTTSDPVFTSIKAGQRTTKGSVFSGTEDTITRCLGLFTVGTHEISYNIYGMHSNYRGGKIIIDFTWVQQPIVYVIFHSGYRLRFLAKQATEINAGYYWVYFKYDNPYPAANSQQMLIFSVSQNYGYYNSASTSSIDGASYCTQHEYITSANISAYAAPPSSSDRRLKSKVTPIDSALSRIEALTGVRYNWDRGSYPERNFPEGRQIGLIAQEVEEVLPELVHTGSDGYKSLSYDKLTAVLVEAVKELREENRALRERIERIEELQKGK